MGKIKKTKTKRNQSPEKYDEEEQLCVDSKENAIHTLLDQLQTANVEEKYCGLQTLALLIETPDHLEQVINQGVIKVAAPLLMDAAGSIRNAASGTLRNMSALKMEVCDAMMDQDVMTSLNGFFQEYAQKWTPDATSKFKDEDIDTFINCTNLLLNLCESSELAIKYLGQYKILDIFPRYLDIGVFGSDIVAAVLQCLFVAIEDNPQAMQHIKNNSEKQLEQILSMEGSDPSILLIKTLAAGVIINACGGNLISLPVNFINEIILTLATTLSIDHRLACNQVSSNIPLSNGAGKFEALKGKEAQVLGSQLKSVTQMLDGQQSAIEIIANICSCEDGDDSMNGGDSSDSDDLESDVLDNGDESVLIEDKLPPEIMEALVSLQLFEKIWARAQLPAQNVMLILKEYEGSQLIYKKIQNLQTRALLCINNMISTLPMDSLGGVNGVYKIWVDTGKLVFGQNLDNHSLIESATAVMRAALDKIKFRENENNSKCNLFGDMALSDIEIMLTGIRECQMPEVRANLIRMVGLLALLLVNNLNETTTSVISSITDFILEQAHKENEVWVLAEALDTLIDLYSEDETDEIAAKVKLVEKMSVLVPIIKNKARQQKRLPKEYKVLVTTVVSNLPRFIKYKKGRVSCI
ncbi:HEAT repeat-containing protein 3 [Achroia grisella]|uniref:HEAT repeat-containing protein 3 n=1 Tax=Achroia grisella TaxID=688607 RepID=UPI0027D203E2|nr:HEAT repeat-containing protein 3 [Achroia grisella]